MAAAKTFYIPNTRFNGDVLGQVAIDNSDTVITFKRQDTHDYIEAPLTIQVAGQTWQYKSAAGTVPLIQLGDGQTMIISPPGGDASYVIVVKGGTGAGYLNIVAGR